MVIAAIGEYGEVAEATKLALLPTFALFTGGTYGDACVADDC
jgi:hypothetical protein